MATTRAVAQVIKMMDFGNFFETVREVEYPDIEQFSCSKNGYYKCPLCEKWAWGEGWRNRHAEKPHYQCEVCKKYCLSIVLHNRFCQGSGDN